jgi:hypothetical protein
MTTPSAGRPPEPAALAALLERLAQLLLLIVAAGLLPGMVPFQPLGAAWSLRISQILVELAPVVLLALLCSLLAQHLQPLARRRIGARIASIGYGLYAALVPLQILAYGSLWFASNGETQQRLEALQTQLLAVQPRLEAAASTAELQQIVPLPADRPAELAAQKQLVLQAITSQLEQQRAQLVQQRNQFQLSSLMATLRGALVAGLMAAGMRLATRRASC